jgi:ferredoxin
MAIQIKNLDIPTIRVKVDREKCQLPMVCDYKCYTKCAQQVFHVHSYPKVSGRFMKPDPNSPKHYLVSGSAAPKCIGCMECTANCPEDAITIEIKLPEVKEGENPYKHPFESLEVAMENQKQIEKLDSTYKGLKKI